MSPKHILFLPVLALLLYLGVYSWNQKSDFLDSFASATGLEAAGVVLKSIRLVQDSVVETWSHYLDLVGVREENVLLHKRINAMEAQLVAVAEERAELLRLRKLLDLPPPEAWQMLGCRVLGNRMGPNSVLQTITIGRGFLTGATPSTPVTTQHGLLGRVYRAGPSTAIVLLLTDPGSRVAVVTQKNRVQGILAGAGPLNPLEMRFVSHNATVTPGELLVTSGIDEVYPKGIPVARITTAGPSDLSPFMAVQAVPLADLSSLEEVLLLMPLHTMGPLTAPQQPLEPVLPPVPPQQTENAR